MTKGNELVACDTWIDATLKANTALTDLVPAARIHDRFAPDPGPAGRTQWPIIIWQTQSPPTDVRGTGGARLMTTADYVVKAVAQVETYTDLGDVAAAIDAALIMTANGGPAGAVPGMPGTRVLHCERIQTFALPEVEDGEQFRHLGGVYRLQLETA